MGREGPKGLQRTCELISVTGVSVGSNRLASGGPFPRLSHIT